ncbi:hypothetical protein NQ317_001279 [Molorchus minor]|uniref:Tryptophan 5-hydroxylase 2 n=1 Tax=Molorchus minor TaxID=1323400 RepID=A0ABQ9IRR7_9CUCU|nr:hypothetical protein NQ317_001279 [Molorchus minor]
MKEGCALHTTPSESINSGNRQEYPPLVLRAEEMSGSGKPLLGLWLYRSGEDWSYKEESPILLKKQPSQSGEEPLQPKEVEKERISVIFTLKNQVGGLVRALQTFQDLGINVQHIESRPSQDDESQVDFLVDIECESRKLEQMGRLLKREVLTMVIGRYGSGVETEFPPPTPLSATASFGKWSGHL